jgi:hypothetical protein
MVGVVVVWWGLCALRAMLVPECIALFIAVR